VKLTHAVGAVICAAMIAGCSERELILEGERLDLREGAPQQVPDGPAGAAQPIGLPATVNLGEWTQRSGNAVPRRSHPAFSASPQRIWAAPIGSGESRQHRITADPVVAGGRIYTLDARATVTATGANGATLWSRDLTPAGERSPNASGGGLAIGDGTLFVTTGFGQLVALDAATGAERWVQRFEAPATAAPAVSGGMVHVVTNDSVARGIDARDGRVRWEISGVPSASGFTGRAAPGYAGNLAILPFPSGEVIAADAGSGERAWSTAVAGTRLGRAWGAVRDITGDPVVVGDTAYVGNATGRVMALTASTGGQRWTAREGAYGPVWPVGGSLFFLSDESQLVRLSAASGELIWAVDLPYFTETRRERRRSAIFAHYGPVLAGGRLWIASDDGVLRGFDPASGALAATAQIPGGAASSPVVVGGVMYVVARNGQLHAFR
jgi:outer membrane protein assembly factor BamB